MYFVFQSGNQNFAHDDQHPANNFKMMLPKPSLYMDYSDKELKIDLSHLVKYLKNDDKILENTSINMYKEIYLCYLRLCAAADYNYIKSACRHEMKQSVTYSVDISLIKNGRA